MKSAIQINDLHFKYPDGTAVFAGLNLIVDKGERVALLGANGAGKSTLLLLLNGFLWPDRGEILLFDETLTRKNVGSLRPKIGLVFQDPDDQLFCPTLFEDVAFGPRNFGATGHDLENRVKEALTSVGLWEKRSKEPYRLSHGQKKRAALATVLSMRPEVMLLDEPSAHLDPASRRDIHEILSVFSGTMLVVSQDLLLAASLCDRAVVIDDGKIVHDGSMSDLLSAPEQLEALGLPFLDICQLCSRYGWSKHLGGDREFK